MDNFICNNCLNRNFSYSYEAAGSSRGVKVYICDDCGLLQSFPRIAHVKDRPRKVTSGAAWGNVRYGKGFITEKSINIISQFIDLNNIDNLCDIGANRGSFINKISTLFPKLKIIAIEPDTRVVEDYKKNENLQIIFDRVENVSLQENSIDFIYSAHTIEHLESPLNTLKQSRDWIRPDGLCYFEVPNTCFIESKDIIEEFFIDKHTFHYTPTTFENLIELSGFEVVEGGKFISNENITFICKPSDKKVTSIDFEHSTKMKSAMKNYEASMQKNISDLVNASKILEDLCSKKDVAFWGAGRIFDSIVVNGGFNPNLLSSLVDKELPKYIDKMHNKSVQFPSELCKLQPEIIVIASRAYKDEIIKEASEMGLKAEILYYGDLFTDL
jgi:SAM-dependent methyltransferase